MTGPTEILLGGASNAGGGAIVNETNLPANLKIDVIGSELDIVGDSDLHADIYGPTAEVKIRGQGDFYGAIFANRLQFSGGQSVAHGDETLFRDFESRPTKVTLKQ